MENEARFDDLAQELTARDLKGLHARLGPQRGDRRVRAESSIPRRHHMERVDITIDDKINSVEE